MSRLQKPAAFRPSRDGPRDAEQRDELPNCRAGVPRSHVANEIGAAMAHELTGPITALMLYVGEIYQNSDGLIDVEGDGETLKQVVERALLETERLCAVIHRMGDMFEAPVSGEAAIAAGREAIAWWSRVGSSRQYGADVSPGAALSYRLTPRESEVLRLVREGCSNKEGGQRMNISHRTFESHRARVMRKFGAKNAADLMRLAAGIREGHNSDAGAAIVEARASGAIRSDGTRR